MRDPLPEAYELVEDGLITEDNFRDFIFANAVRLWGTQNPRFFEGTVVAKEAAAVLAQSRVQCAPLPNSRGKPTADRSATAPLTAARRANGVLLGDRCLKRPPLLSSWWSPRANRSCRIGQATLP